MGCYPTLDFTEPIGGPEPLVEIEKTGEKQPMFGSGAALFPKSNGLQFFRKRFKLWRGIRLAPS